MDDNETTYVVWLDNTLLMLGSFILMAFMMMALINPPKASDATDVQPVLGTMMVEVIWADKIDVDVDLWVEAPGDAIVGYSAKSGKVFNLLRDDLGTPGDLLSLNYEVAYTRGAPPGEYCINLHLYRNSGSAPLPIEVKVAVTMQNAVNKTTSQIATKTVKLTKVGEELTVFRFRLDNHMNLVAGSLHDLQKPLRSAKQ
jgi:hypothetical protein